MAKKSKSDNGTLELQNACKTLYANIRFMSVDSPIRTIVVTSSVPNEGKSTVSVNLATAIATSGCRVLLMECDMRRRSLASMLGIHVQYGLYSVLSGSVSLRDATVSTRVANMDFLDVEPRIPNPADLIASRRFMNLIDAAEDAYDYVVIDTPPVGTFVDAAELSTLVDATVMVVRPNMVHRDELMHAYDQLSKAEANVVGICATFVESSSSEYYYAYYTKDGKNEKKSKKSKKSKSGKKDYDLPVGDGGVVRSASYGGQGRGQSQGKASYSVRHGSTARAGR